MAVIGTTISSCFKTNKNIINEWGKHVYLNIFLNELPF